MVGFVKVVGVGIRARNTVCARHPSRSHLRMAASEVVEDPLVMYVIVRRDLITELDWPMGSIITQGIHAAVGAVWRNREESNTLEYCGQDGGVENASNIGSEAMALEQVKNFLKSSIVYTFRSTWNSEPYFIPVFPSPWLDANNSFRSEE